MERIVVTGSGIISALGIGKEITLQKLLAEESAISTVKHLRTKHQELSVGEVPATDEDLKSFLGITKNEIINRTSLLGRVALREALAEANLSNGADGLRIAFVAGNIVGGMEKSEIHYRDFFQNDDFNEYISMHDCGACTEIIAKEFGGRFSLATTISTACSSAANALILGGNLLRAGYADIVVAGGTDCLSKFHLNGFNMLMILDPQRCRPFDETRRGINLGEAGAFLVLEKERAAQRRGSNPIAILSGYGNACDAFHQTAMSPDGEGAYLAMQKALQMAGLRPDDIDYINAHGTGTENNDACEGAAVERLFGERIPPVSSTKSYTGHTTAAAGALESVISLLTIQHQFIPSNLGFSNPIQTLNFTPVKKVIRNADVRHVLTNSFGFGGNDSSCIFSKI